MSRKILVDTSVWVDYFNDEPSTTVFIDNNLFTNEIYITGPIITELMAGIKGTKEKERLQYSLGAVTTLDVTLEDWIMAGEIVSDMIEKGRFITKTDALIASIAINNRCELLSSSHHKPAVDAVKNAKIDII